jgi:predicted amino acid-binding ACT domain protein
MTAFWDILSSSVVEVHDVSQVCTASIIRMTSVIALGMEEVLTSETSDYCY